LVIDSKSKEPIPSAHACFEELKTNKKHYQATDKNGIVINPSTQISEVAISFVGYKNVVDTLQPNKDYIIELYPQIFDLDQVIVTASLTPQKADKSIYNVKVIDSRKIELKAATNLSDILKDEINFQVNYDPALGSSLKLKGLSGNNVKILVDGVPVIGRMGGNIDLSQLNLYNVDHVEVVEGPMSVIYGSNALAGAINIITKENLHSTYTASINTYIENLGTYNFDAMVAYKKGNSNFSIAGGRNFFKGIYLDVDTNRSQQWKPKEQYNADFYYTYNKSNNKVKFQSSFMDEHLLDKGDQLPITYRTAHDSWFNSQRFTNRLEYDLKLKNDYSIITWVSHSIYQRKKLTYTKDFIDSSSKLVKDNTSNDTTTSNALNYKFLFGDQGAEKKLTSLSGADINFEDAIGKRIVDKQQEMTEYALFSSLIYNPNSRISIQPGFRYSYYTRFKSIPIPSIVMKWNPNQYLSIRTSYARGYRTPSLKELFIQFKDINHDIRPNDSLKSERGHDFSVSVNLNTDKTDKIHFTNVELSLFYTQTKDRIYLAPQLDVGTTTFKYINISYFNTIGGQLSFKYSFYPNFDFGFGFGTVGTYASLLYSNQGLSKYKFSSNVSLNTSYMIPGIGVKVYLNYKFTGLDYNANLDEKPESAALDEGIKWSTIEKYHTIDISFIKKLLSNRLTLTCGVKNLLDNTIVLAKGSSGDNPHTGGDGSSVGYGRLFFSSLSYNIYK